MEIQDAEKQQAADLACLINLAGEGIPEYLWTGMAEDGQSPMEVGALRAGREEGGFSYRNARVCMEGDELMGMIIAYHQPDPYDTSEVKDYPDIVQPLVLLEAMAPGSWYINAIATFEQHRGKGVAQALLKKAEELAVQDRCPQMSLIVASENTNAKGLYKHLGYNDVASLPVVDYPGSLHGGQWDLMVKELQPPAHR